MIKKYLSLFGKTLIILSIFWPIPVGYIIQWIVDLCLPLDWEDINYIYGSTDQQPTIYSIIRCSLEQPTIGLTGGERYWFPLIGIFLVGFMLCLICNYKSNTTRLLNNKIKEDLSKFKNNPVLLFYIRVVWNYALKIIAIFYLIMGGIKFLLFTANPEHTGYVLGTFLALVVLGIGIFVGYWFYKNSKKDE